MEVWFGPYRLHPTEGLWRGTRELHVTPKALSVLYYLASRRGSVIAKDDLVRAIWNDVAVSDSALTSCIKELRRALKDDARRPRFIETLNRRGYRFTREAVSGAVEDALSPSPAQRDVAAPFVGREQTLTRLTQVLDRARMGQRQVLVVSGEAGIGKTAVLEALVRQVAQDGVWSVGRGNCVEQLGQSEPYQPLLDAVRRLSRRRDGALFAAVLRRCAPSWLAQLPTLQTPGELRSLARRTAGVTPERMRRELIDALETAAATSPVLLCLEDIHWSDVATLDWIAAMANRSEGAPLALIATCRRTDARAAQHPLRGMLDSLLVKGLCDEIALQGLTSGDVRAYMTPADGRHDAARDQLAEAIHRHTDGNPLFVVNVLRDLVGRGILEWRDGRWMLTRTVDGGALGVPEDVGRTIDRQLDRLAANERLVLETMSIAGDAAAAAAIAPGVDMPVTAVESTLAALAREQWFVGERGAVEWPDGTISGSFAFLHAIYREALAARVHPARRVELHRAIGERLQRGYGAQSSSIAAELAVHYENARDPARAVPFLLRAAETSRGRSAYAVAEHQLRRALTLLGQLPAGRARDDLEIEVRIALGAVLMARRGWGADEIEVHYRHALDLSTDTGAAHRFSALWGLWLFRWGRGEIAIARDLASTLRGWSEQTQDPAYRLQALHADWATSFSSGDFDGAERHAAEGIALYRVDQHAALTSAYGNHDPGVCARLFRARALALAGAVDEALQMNDGAIALATELGHPFTLQQALFFAATVDHARQDPHGALAHASASAGIARDHGFRLFLACASILQGWALVHLGRDDEGLRLVQDGERSLRAEPHFMFPTHMCAVIGEAYLQCRRYDEGLGIVADGLAFVQSADERFYEGELHRLQGELTLAANPAAASDVAEAAFRQALAVTERQGARRLTLRAATSFAKLHHVPRDARRGRLAHAIGGLTEGLDLSDMRAARRCLRELT